MKSKDEYSVYEYQEAKEILKDAVVLSGFKNSNIYEKTWYRNHTL